MTNETITIQFIHQIFKSIISSTLDRALWKLLNSLDQRKGGKVMKQNILFRARKIFGKVFQRKKLRGIKTE